MARRTLPYFILAEREDGIWTMAFGSKDKDDVVSERQDRRDHYVRASDLKVVRLPDRRNASMVAALAALNAPVQA